MADIEVFFLKAQPPQQKKSFSHWLPHGVFHEGQQITFPKYFFSLFFCTQRRPKTKREKRGEKKREKKRTDKRQRSQNEMRVNGASQHVGKLTFFPSGIFSSPVIAFVCLLISSRSRCWALISSAFSLGLPLVKRRHRPAADAVQHLVASHILVVSSLNFSCVSFYVLMSEQRYGSTSIATTNDSLQRGRQIPVLVG